MADNSRSSHRQTQRFARKNEAILDAAAALFNQNGLKGVTLSDVAASVGLNTTSVTYYFPKKEDLAAACVLRSIRLLGEIVGVAQERPSSEERLREFVCRFCQLQADVADGKRPQLMTFDDVRALTGASAPAVFTAYEDLFRQVRRLVRNGEDPGLSRNELNARTYLLMSLTLDVQSWIQKYESDDYARAAERIVDVMLGGLRGRNSDWAPHALSATRSRDESESAAARDAFLRVATQLVNEQGYHGASVEKISARLNVTKGSFYHHNDSKDDLLVSCFERSFAAVRTVQWAAIEQVQNGFGRVSAAANNLVRHQLSADGPLLRYTALHALPLASRTGLTSVRGRLLERFAGMISDGIADGSIRPVDPAIAARLLDAMINAAANLKRWAPGTTEENAVEIFARPLFEGLFACPRF